MAEYMEEFKFPDEIEAEKAAEARVSAKENDDNSVEIDIEIEDDTPTQDRGREPLPKDIVENLEKDELDEYSESVKIKMKQLKKVWNDERREKEAALREQQEAIVLAQRVLEENKKLKSRLSEGEETLVSTYKGAAEQELALAKREYREAYDSGDIDRIVEAQEKLTDAKMKMSRAETYQPIYKEALQEDNFDVQIQQQTKTPGPSRAVAEWQEQNDWFGRDEEMTALALGLHEKLVKSGVQAESKEYFSVIDKTMRKRFPEQFEEEQEEEVKNEEPKAQRTKPSTVVAPATRSTSSKKVKLKQSQLAIARKLGLTPEQYVRELMKMEA
jgi:hypothetical protein